MITGECWWAIFLDENGCLSEKAHLSRCTAVYDFIQHNNLMTIPYIFYFISNTIQGIWLALFDCRFIIKITIQIKFIKTFLEKIFSTLTNKNTTENFWKFFRAIRFTKEKFWKILRPKILRPKKFSWPKNFHDKKTFKTKKFSWQKIFHDKKIIMKKNF